MNKTTVGTGTYEIPVPYEKRTDRDAGDRTGRMDARFG